MPSSSPVGIEEGPDTMTFSTKVEPLLGKPKIKIGFILRFVLSIF